MSDEMKSSYYIMLPQDPRDTARFLNTYVSEYFLPQTYMATEKESNLANILPFSQSSKCVENEMEDLIWNSKRKWSKQDVLHILAWKIDGIDHLASKEQIILKETWSDKNNCMKGVHRGIEINNIELLTSFVADHVSKWREIYSHKWNAENALTVLKELDAYIKKNGISRMGPVHLITLLSFVSQGELPIYDKQAMKALIAYENGYAPGKVIYFSDLPNVSEKSFWSKYQDYINKLETNFGSDYKTNRKIDQALWVYGHLFVRAKSKKECSEYA